MGYDDFGNWMGFGNGIWETPEEINARTMHFARKRQMELEQEMDKKLKDGFRRISALQTIAFEIVSRSMNKLTFGNYAEYSQKSDIELISESFDDFKIENPGK